MRFKESIKRFNLPKGWAWVPIEELAKLSFSSVDKKSVEGEKAVRLCNYMDVFYNRRICEGMPFMDSTASDSDIKKFTLNAGDVVLTKDSETPEEIAFAAVIDEQIDNLVCGYHLAVLRPDKTKVTGEYLMSAINFHPNHHQFVRLANGATRFGLGIDSLNNALLPLPPLSEQRKIAEIIRTWDEAIETAGDELSRLKEQLVSLIAKLTLRQCVGKPEQGWHDVKIGDLLEEVDRDVEWDDGKTFSLISCGRRASGIFLREKKAGCDIDVKKMYEVKAGDFIVSQKQSAHAGWGMVTEEFHGHHVSPMYTIYGLKGKGLHMPFFNWLCKMPWMRHQAYLSSYGVHIEKMSFVSRLFLKTKIRIPALLIDQEKACAVLESAESEVKAATLKLEKLNDQKRGLMQKLLTGEVRVAA